MTPESPQLVPLLTSLGWDLFGLLVLLLVFLLRWSLVMAWLAWWLWGADWRRVFPVLRSGGWAPVALLMVLVAIVWSQLDPGVCTLFGLTTIGNFWWQLWAVGLLVALTLFCGWLQLFFAWEPAPVMIEAPPESDHGQSAEHAHP